MENNEIVEDKVIGDVLHWEEERHFSREVITLAPNIQIEIGAILGKVKSTGQYMPLNLSAKDGTETPTAVALTRIREPMDESTGLAILRHAILKIRGIIWPDKITAEQIISVTEKLDQQGIILRE